MSARNLVHVSKNNHLQRPLTTSTFLPDLLRKNISPVGHGNIEKCRCLSMSSKQFDHETPSFKINSIPLLRRNYSSSLSVYGEKEVTATGSDHHQLYKEQIQELEKERIELFGANDENLGRHMNDMERSIDDMNNAREEIYNFSKEEKKAWGNNGKNIMDHRISSTIMDSIRQAKEAQVYYENEMEKKADLKMKDIIQSINANAAATHVNGEENNAIFTHLNKSGEEVSMVDVGDKSVSKRVAVARSSVWFPPEVMEAFGLDYHSDSAKSNKNADVVGPKGPIFATARIAGIMGAKRTSDLIPLCHPLPLSKVHVDIQLQGDRAIIECECRVTHTTGVEMEALAGASVAALTIYDMVKAVSHNVRIESTFLVEKKGGKRDVKKQT